MAKNIGIMLGGLAEGGTEAFKRVTDAKLGQQFLDLRREALGAAAGRQQTAQLDGVISDNLTAISAAIKEARKAGAAPDAINKFIDPWRQQLMGVMTAAGRDTSMAGKQLDALINLPAGEAGEETAATEIGKLRQDLAKGFITQEEYKGRVERLTRPESPPNIVENIRRKIAAGESLSEGEKRVYDDALKADPIARLLAATLGAGGAAKPPATPAKPTDPAGVRR